MKPANIIALVVFLGLTAWVVSLSPRSSRAVQQGFLTVASPFIRSGSAMEESTRRFFEEVRAARELEAENSVLREELAMLRIYSKDREQIYEENEKLAEALDYKKRSVFELVPARVIQRDRATWWSTIVVNRGFDDAIGVGNAVIVPDGLVGRVLTVSTSSCVVLLITDENCQVAARTQGSLALRGMVSGERGNFQTQPNLVLRPLPIDTEVDQGRQVFSTGVGGVFPDSYIIGEVLEVRKREFYAEAIVRPSVDFEQLDQVFIVVHDEPVNTQGREER